MSQMAQSKFKSGIEIVPPVPRRAATAFRCASSEGAKECSPRRKPWGADPHPPHKLRRGERNARRVNHRTCGNKLGSRYVRRKPDAAFLAPFAKNRLRQPRERRKSAAHGVSRGGAHKT